MKRVLYFLLLAIAAASLSLGADQTDRSATQGIWNGGVNAPALSATSSLDAGADGHRFEVVETTIPQIQAAMDARELTSRELVRLYLARLRAFDVSGPSLNAVGHLNLGAEEIAQQLDRERARSGPRGPLHGIPVLLKDNIDTGDLPTTAGSVALEGSIPLQDAFITRKLREAGAVILGKATLTEFANFLTTGMPAGYSSLFLYGFNPYDPRPLPGGDGRPVLSPGGSSSASGIAVSANLVTVAIGSETSGSILSPANQNSVVGIKPTVGLVSRSGVIPITADQDVPGPLARTVIDAAILLEAIAGCDPEDPVTCEKAVPRYTAFLDSAGLRGARIGVPRDFYWDPLTPQQRAIVEGAIRLMQDLGAEIIDVDIPTARQLNAFPICTPPSEPNCSSVLKYGFKRDLNAYLSGLPPKFPVRSLADVIAFNSANPERALRYGQVLAEASERVDLDPDSKDTAKYLADRATDLRLAKDEGIDAVMDLHKLDALLFPATRGADIAARAGYPSVIVPAGYLPPTDPVEGPTPYGVTFTGKAFSEPRLISLAFSFEQASRARRPPTSTPPLPR